MNTSVWTIPSTTPPWTTFANVTNATNATNATNVTWHGGLYMSDATAAWVSGITVLLFFLFIFVTWRSKRCTNDAMSAYAVACECARHCLSHCGPPSYSVLRARAEAEAEVTKRPPPNTGGHVCPECAYRSTPNPNPV